MKDGEARDSIWRLEEKVRQLENIIEKNELDTKMYTKELHHIICEPVERERMSAQEFNRLVHQNTVPVYKVVRMLLNHLGLQIERNPEPIEYVLTEKEE